MLCRVHTHAEASQSPISRALTMLRVRFTQHLSVSVSALGANSDLDDDPTRKIADP